MGAKRNVRRRFTVEAILTSPTYSKEITMPVRTLSALWLILIAVLLGGTSMAQEDAQQEDFGPKLFNLRFQGGTVADYVAAVAKAAGGANVFVAPEAAQVPMPAIELQNVAVANAIGVLHGRTHVDDRRMIQLAFNEGARSATGEQPIFSITAKVSGTRAMSSNQNRIWSIASLQTHEVTADDMLTAVQAALDLIGKDEAPAQLRLHDSTGLLIARGTPEQLDTIGEVLDRLEQSAAIRYEARRAAAQPDQEKAELRKQLAQQGAVIQQLQERIKTLESQRAASSDGPRN